MAVIIFQYTGAIILGGLVIGLFIKYKAIRDTAMVEGCSRLQGEFRGIAYPLAGILGIALFIVLIGTVDSAGLLGSLVMAVLFIAAEYLVFFVMPRRKPSCARPPESVGG